MRGRRGQGYEGERRDPLIARARLTGVMDAGRPVEQWGAVTLLTMQPDQYSLSSAAIEGRREVVY